MAYIDPTLCERMEQLRHTVLDDYAKNMETPDADIKLAAFGAACMAIQTQTGCNLKVAAMLMRCWISERQAGG